MTPSIGVTPPTDRLDANSAGSRLFRLLGEQTVIIILLAILGALIVLPTVFVFLGAIAKNVIDLGEGFSFDTLIGVFTSPQILFALFSTIVMALGVGIISTVFGALLAWTLTRAEIRYARVWETLIMVPLFLSPFVGTLAYLSLFAPRSGMINKLLEGIGINFNLMSISGIVFAMVVHFIPYGYLFLAGTLRNTDSSLEESSYVNGRNIPQTALRILFPMLWHSILSSVLFISILSLGMFSVPSLLGERGLAFRPLAVHVYRGVYGYPANFALAASIGVMMVILSLLALYFYRQNTSGERRFVMVTGRSFATNKVDVGLWRYPLTSMLGLFFIAAVVLPYAALLLMCLTPYQIRDFSELVFTMRNITSVLSENLLLETTVNTIIVSVVVPVGCVILGLIIVFVADRLKPRGSKLLNYIAIAPLAIPGIVFGGGVIWAYVRTPLYGTLTIMVVALIGSYLPHAVRLIGNGLHQIDASLEEAAYVNGASRPRTLLTIVAPLLKPSIFSGAVLIFIFAVREINTTIMLYSPDTQILSVLAWNYASSSSMSQAAVVGMLQTLTMVVGVVGARIFLGVRASRSM